MSDHGQARVDILLQRLRETVVELRAELGAEVDMVLEPTGATPVLLRDTYRALQESEARYRALYTEMSEIYRNTPVGLLVLDREMRIVRINELLAELSGMTVEAHIGRYITEVVPTLAPTLIPLFRIVLECPRVSPTTVAAARETRCQAPESAGAHQADPPERAGQKTAQAAVAPHR